MNANRGGLWLTLAAASCLTLPSFADDAVKWRVGPEFRKQLDASIGVTWTDATLREAMRSLSRNEELALWLDRRVDPEQKVQFVAQNEQVEQMLGRFAAERKLGLSVIGSVIYLGPVDSAGNVATLAAIKRQEASQLPPNGKAAWLKSAPLAWPELAQPRELVEQMVKQANATLTNPELVPHDLWAAGDFPSLPACDRLSLLLAGFGLSYQFDNTGARVRLIPAPKDATYEFTYTARGDAAKAATEISRLFPDVKLKRQGTQLTVTGRYEDHDKIERLLRGESIRTTKVAVGEKRFTVNVERQPAGAVLKRIATDTGRELKYDPDLATKLNEPVTFRVKDATLEELLKATLGTLDVIWKWDDKVLEVLAKP